MRIFFVCFSFLILWRVRNYFFVCLFLYFSLINVCIYLFIYLFRAVLGLRCCARVFSSCSEREPLFVAVRGLLIAVASLVVEHGL